MIKNISVRLLPSEASDDKAIKNIIAKSIGAPASTVNGYHIIKHSIDARGKVIWVNLTLKVFLNEPFQLREYVRFAFNDVAKAKNSVVVIGAGPAGLFAALYLIEQGIRPVIVERGKDVKARRRDLAILNKQGEINPESNYCFGEGGAGTYSDGKLYTRSTKRGDVNRILQIFYHFGAEENILYKAHPHIGTNKLPQIITAMRKQIIDSGGIFLFEKKVVDFIIKNNYIISVVTADGDHIKGDAVILATGHSARDVFEMLHRKNILIEAKPFALGVRIEHPQDIIDKAQYHCDVRGIHLPPASYSLVQQINNRGVFSFCMCPGGIIAPAATSPGELVVNGWSPSKRNNPYANSGMVVQCVHQDILNLKDMYVEKKQRSNPLSMMFFQQHVERKAFEAGGGKFVAPAQRMVDFLYGKISSSMPDCSYLPGIVSVDLKAVLPDFVYHSLQEGFKFFAKKMKGYLTNDAVVVATESRTSSPVRIPRNEHTLHHPQVHNLYPCGEGAGYAGGIVSAAMDGERVAAVLVKKIL